MAAPSVPEPVVRLLSDVEVAAPFPVMWMARGCLAAALLAHSPWGGDARVARALARWRALAAPQSSLRTEWTKLAKQTGDPDVERVARMLFNKAVDTYVLPAAVEVLGPELGPLAYARCLDVALNDPASRARYDNAPPLHRWAVAMAVADDRERDAHLAAWIEAVNNYADMSLAVTRELGRAAQAVESSRYPQAIQALEQAEFVARYEGLPASDVDLITALAGLVGGRSSPWDVREALAAVVRASRRALIDSEVFEELLFDTPTRVEARVGEWLRAKARGNPRRRRR